MNRVRRTERRPTVTAAADEAHPKAPAAQCASNNSLITGAIERDRRRRIAPPAVEVPLRAPKVTETFFPGGGDEIDRPARRQPRAIDFLSDGKHDGEAAAVVVYSWTDEARTMPPD